MRVLCLSFLLASSCAGGAAADESLDILSPPIEVALVKRDGQSLSGQLSGYGPDYFVLVNQGGAEQQIVWADLPARVVFTTFQQAMDRTQAEHWLTLARLLMQLADGVSLGESALAVAVALDADLIEQADSARGARPASFAALPPAPDDQGSSGATDDSLPLFDPASVTWNDVDPDQFDSLVQADKFAAQQVAKQLGIKFNLVETDYFLFFTNLSEREAYEWQRILDLMYDRVSYLLGIPPGINVWKGKAVVFMFATQGQFAQFEEMVFDNEVTQQVGICHQHPSGAVRIVFYKLADEKFLKQVMIHEAAHGVIHRYRSPQRIVSWLNEGIAEWTASSVLQYYQPIKAKKRFSARHVKEQGRLGYEFFLDNSLPSELYGTALAVTELLLRRGSPKFIQFINGIKDGKPWEQSLLDIYELTPEQLVKLYGASIAMPRLRQ